MKLKLKDLQKIYKYPKNHGYDDNYKIHFGFVVPTWFDRKGIIGIAYTTDKKEAYKILKARLIERI